MRKVVPKELGVRFESNNFLGVKVKSTKSKNVSLFEGYSWMAGQQQQQNKSQDEECIYTYVHTTEWKILKFVAV